MTTLTDGRQFGLLPTRRFWALSALVLPATVMALVGGVAALGIPWTPVALACLVLSAAGLARERAVRRMALGWRVTWAVVGAGVTLTVALIASIAISLTLYAACGDGSCLG